MPPKGLNGRGNKAELDESAKKQIFKSLQAPTTRSQTLAQIKEHPIGRPRTRALTKEQQSTPREQIVAAQHSLPTITRPASSKPNRNGQQPACLLAKPSKPQINLSTRKSKTSLAISKTRETKKNPPKQRKQPITISSAVQDQGNTIESLRPNQRTSKKATNKSRQNESTATKITPWLDSLPSKLIEPPHTSEAIRDVYESDSTEELEEDMTTSNIAEGTTPSFSHSVGTSTINQETQRRANEDEFLRQLQARNADPEESTPDKLARELKKKSSPPMGIVLPFKKITELARIAKEFAEKCETSKPNSNSYATVEEFRQQINNYLPSCRLFTITNADFYKDIVHSRISNEAVFQRTVMLSAIDRWQLDDVFDYDCEGLWVARNKYLLPTTGKSNDKIKKKKPDLALYFSLKALRGTNIPKNVTIHEDLRPCISPDNKTHRCFPFVFIEAKKSSSKLTGAIYDGMHSASQALYNIYVCMRKVQRTDSFFSSIRVFSIMLNADMLIARIHRARISPVSQDLEFLFDQICEINKYTRDRLSLLIRTILMEYALPELFPILKETYKDIAELYAREKEEEEDRIEQEQEELKRRQADETSKRKAGNSSKRSNKRRNTKAPIPQSSMPPETSFGMSGLHTDGN